MSNTWRLALTLLSACLAGAGCGGGKDDSSGNGAGTGGFSATTGGQRTIQAGTGGEAASAGGSESGGAAAQGGSGSIETRGATVGLVCPSPDAGCDADASGSVAATNLYDCSYLNSISTLHVEFRAGTTFNRIELFASPFTGSGTYQATADGSTDVIIVVGGTVPTRGTASGPPLRDCALTVTSNFASEASVFDVALEIACPILSSGNLCEVACSVSPATFQVSVHDCVARP